MCSAIQDLFDANRSSVWRERSLSVPEVKEFGFVKIWKNHENVFGEKKKKREKNTKKEEKDRVFKKIRKKSALFE